jgi:mannose/cellobiose epimerase-like protein (N-acyl-D-glucosamine 2-epimerase family)
MQAMKKAQSTPLLNIAQDARGWLFNDALPLWYDQGIDFDNWGFTERLDERGLPIDEPRRINVQARQTYVFALAGQMGWAKRDTRRAVVHGLEAIEHYRREDGLYAFKLNADGSYFVEEPEVYGQAFVLFAWAHAGIVLDRRQELEAKALTLLGRLRDTLGHAKGGFFEDTKGTLPLRSNPHMHLFEAAQAWMAISQAPQWAALVEEIATLALTRFIDPQSGWLREHFDGDWRVVPDAHGILAEPGHQFEWAWLLERYSQIRQLPQANRAAARLYAAGLEGVDPSRNVPFMAYSLGQGPRAELSRLWPSTEWLKAALIFDDQAQATAAYDSLRLFLDVAFKGLWADKLSLEGKIIPEPAPASTLYHIICAISECVDATTA